MPSNPTSSGRGSNYTGSRSNSPLYGLFDDDESEDFCGTLNFTNNKENKSEDIIDLTKNNIPNIPTIVDRIPSGIVGGS